MNDAGRMPLMHLLAAIADYDSIVSYQHLDGEDFAQANEFLRQAENVDFSKMSQHKELTLRLLVFERRINLSQRWGKFRAPEKMLRAAREMAARVGLLHPQARAIRRSIREFYIAWKWLPAKKAESVRLVENMYNAEIQTCQFLRQEEAAAVLRAELAEFYCGGIDGEPQHKLERALEIYRESYPGLLKHKNTLKEDLVAAVHNMAAILLRFGAIEDAQQVLRIATQEAPDHPCTAKLLSNAGLS